MLCLTRRYGESIRIGHEIRITVLDTRHAGQVKIGIEAPADVEVHREEVYQKLHPEERWQP